jgi:hypothetical protein
VSKYGAPYYGRPLYGISPFRDLNVEPMSRTVLDFNAVRIGWQSPSGLYSQVRLVRNQNGFPETPEDGVIIWQEDTLLDTDPLTSRLSRNTFTDGVDNPDSAPLQQGREVFYSMFLFNYNDKVWETAGNIYGVIPTDTGVQERLYSYLPRVYTSKEQSPLGEVDYDSELAKFLDGITFTYEQLQTLIDLTIPDYEKSNFPYELLAVEQSNLGFSTPEVTLPVVNQKRLIREALGLYTQRGTIRGLQNYAEALTGYPTTVTVSDNLMLNVQDSTFFGGTGNWVVDETATLEVSDLETPAVVDGYIDTDFAGLLITDDAGSMTLGANDITKSVPILPETEYTVSMQVKSPNEDGEITLSVYFMDQHGREVIADSPVTATTSGADDSWQLVEVTFTSPELATYASLEVAWDAAGEYYVDEICFQPGDEAVFSEARLIKIFLDSNKINYIRNPSFELGTDFWTDTGDATITVVEEAPDSLNAGTQSVEIVAIDPWTFTSSPEPVQLGQFYTASAFLKGEGNRLLSIVTYDDDLNVVDRYEEEVTLSVTEWLRFSLSIPLDIESVATKIAIEVSGDGDTTTYIDAVQLERNFQVSDYFDGSFSSEYGVVWEDAPFESYSHEYPGKVKKMLRLAQTIIDWIPMNAFWIIEDWSGLVYNNRTI